MLVENSIQSFVFESFDVRIVDRDGNPWFVANDVGDILGLDRSAVRNFVSKLKDEYKDLVSIRTNGGPQKLLIISEQGLYKMLMKSRKPNAEKFQDWIAEDVLPSIRKTGSYSSKDFQLQLNEIINQMQNLNSTMNKIYLIASKDLDVCKIGISSNVDNRLKSLQTSFPYVLELFDTIDGDFKLEKEIHNKFKDHNIRGEWFKLTKDIKDMFGE